jgi:hypothetical protein
MTDYSEEGHMRLAPQLKSWKRSILMSFKLTGYGEGDRSPRLGKYYGVIYAQTDHGLMHQAYMVILIGEDV